MSLSLCTRPEFDLKEFVMAKKNWVALAFPLTLAACADPFEKCVAAKQEAFRKANPKANYAALANANEKFREDCKSSTRQ